MRDDVITLAHIPSVTSIADDLGKPATVMPDIPLFVRIEGEMVALPCYGYALEQTPEGLRLVLLGYREDKELGDAR